MDKFDLEEYFEELENEEPLEKDRSRAEKRRLDALHKERKMNIIKNVKCWKNGLIPSRDESYFTHSDFRKNFSKRRANRKVRHTDIGNGANYKKVHDVQWECS